jgi:hypothetical protein
MTFLQLQRRLFLRRLHWHHGVMLFMCLATNLSGASSIPSEHSAPGPAWVVLEFQAAALQWPNGHRLE